MEEILCCIGAAVFSILAVIFGVRRSTRTGTNRGIRNDGGRYNDLVQNHQRLERDKDRISKLDKRDNENIRRCADIIKRVRKREQEVDNKK